MAYRCHHVGQRPDPRVGVVRYLSRSLLKELPVTLLMYSCSVPVCKAMLSNLSHLLDKAVANAQARKIDPAVLIGSRLAPDMFPLVRQVLIACDSAKNGVARLSGVPAPTFDDKEATFEELQARIAKTVAYLDSVPAAALEGSDSKDVTFPSGRDTTRTMKGEDYLRQWMLPNLYFHITTAYNILRHNGVDIGKGDYLAGAQR